jgi:hypothetical protein
LYSGVVTLDGNLISSNTATLDGGGMYLYTSDAVLVNNVVADNQANSSGSGLYVYSAAPRLLHTTIARNTSGDGSGIHIANHPMLPYSTVSLTNTILVSHTVGVTVTAGNMVTLKGVLWYSNSVDTGGAGNIAVTNADTGNSAFAADGYHLTAASAAIDQGINSRVTTDIERDARPQGNGYDLGADEYLGARGIIDPGLGGAIIYTSSQGLATTVQVPPDAVTTTISLFLRNNQRLFGSLLGYLFISQPGHSPPPRRGWAINSNAHVLSYSLDAFKKLYFVAWFERNDSLFRWRCGHHAPPCPARFTMDGYYVNPGNGNLEGFFNGLFYLSLVSAGCYFEGILTLALQHGVLLGDKRFAQYFVDLNLFH